MPRPDARATASTHDTILAVAGPLFAERGYAGVSMRDIAAAAGLRNQASLYHHFPSKRALYEAVLSHELAPVLALVARAPGAGPSAALADELIGHLAGHPYLPRLIQRLGIDERRYLPRAIPDLLRPLYEQGRALLADADTGWAANELPHLSLALYLLIFGWFANAPLVESVLAIDPADPAAVRRQRAFVREAVTRLLDGSGRQPAGPR
jgi:AcrR family transcriptional regulator